MLFSNAERAEKTQRPQRFDSGLFLLVTFLTICEMKMLLPTIRFSEITVQEAQIPLVSVQFPCCWQQLAVSFSGEKELSLD